MVRTPGAEGDGRLRGKARRQTRRPFSGSFYAAAAWSAIGQTPSAFHNGPMSESQSTLHCAAALAGGVRELARRLGVPSKQLTSWMEGEVPTPHTVFQRALAFVAPRA